MREPQAMIPSGAPEPIVELQPRLDAALRHSRATSSMPHTVPGTNSATFRPPLQAPNRRPRNKLSTIRTPRNPPPQARPEQGPCGSAGSFPSPCFRSDYDNSAETAPGRTRGRPHGAFRRAGSVPGRGGRTVEPPPVRCSGSVAEVTGACVCDASGVRWRRVGCRGRSRTGVL